MVIPLAVDLDEIQLLVQGVELGHRGLKLASRQSSDAVGLCEGDAALGVDEMDAHPVSSIP